MLFLLFPGKGKELKVSRAVLCFADDDIFSVLNLNFVVIEPQLQLIFAVRYTHDKAKSSEK